MRISSAINKRLKMKRVGLASYHLEGNGQIWFLQIELDIPNHTWQAFIEHPIRSQKLVELSKL